jgi:Kef-type K+ transport system membrane component KefB
LAGAVPVELIIALLLILAAAKVFGEIFEKLKQPAIVGELLAGIILGPSLLNFLDPLSLAAGDPMAILLDVLTTLAIFFVVFYAGVELHMKDFYEVMLGKSMYIAVGSFIITYLMGFLVGLYFLGTYLGALFLGLCISITALPVSVKILNDLGRLHTRTGSAIIGTAIVHDVISFSMLGVLIGISAEGGGSDPWHLSMMLLKIALFMSIIFAAERSFHIKDGWLAKKFSGFMSKLKTKEAQFSVALIIALYFAVLAEFLGLSYIIGAFYGGLLISQKIIGTDNFRNLKSGISSISMGFFAPIFIAYLGLMFDLKELGSVMAMFLAVLAVGMLSKFLSGFLASRMAGYSILESKIIGTGINARGMMEMVIAITAFKYGFIDRAFFTILIALALITTVITPGILRHLYRGLPAAHDAPPSDTAAEVGR